MAILTRFLGHTRPIIEKPKFAKYTAESTFFNALEQVKDLEKAGPTKWISSDEKVAEVNEKSGDVTLKKAGSATLTAEFGTEKNAAKYKMKVKAPKSLFSDSSNTKSASVAAADEEVLYEPKKEETAAPVKGKGVESKIQSENTLSVMTSNKVIIDGWRRDVGVTVNYEISNGNALDNLNDILAGGGDVSYDGSGNISFVEGSFTDKKATSKASAADIFNEIGVFFAYDTDHNSGIGGTTATADDIDEYKDSASGKTVYTYTPSVSIGTDDSVSSIASAERIPMVGNEVIITADSSGNVESLYSSYNKGAKVDSCYSFDAYDEDNAKDKIVSELLNDASVSGLVEGDNVSEKSENLKKNLTLGKPAKVLLFNDSYGEYSFVPAYKVLVKGDAGVSESAIEIRKTAYINANNEEVLAFEDLLRHDHEEEAGQVNILKDGPVPVTFTDLPKDNGITVSYANGDDNDARKAAAKKLLSVLKTTKDRYKGTIQEGIFNQEVKVKCVFGAPSVSAYWDSSDMNNLRLVFQLTSAAATNETELESLAGHEFSHALLGRYFANDENFLINIGETKILSEAYADVIRDLVAGSRVPNDGEMKYSEIDLTATDTSSYKKVLKYAAYKMMADDRTKDVSVDTWKEIFLGSLCRLPSDASLLNARYAITSAAKEIGGFDNPRQQAVKEAFSAVGISSPDTIRISLTWGENPSDLDSHLVGPAADDSGQFHVWYSNRTYSYENKYAADLDYDDVSSYGPEITTIYRQTPGEYYFMVNNYSVGGNSDVPDNTKMAASGAIVRLYYGNTDNKQQKEYKIDTSSKGTYWTVFKLTIGNDGTIDVQDINQYTVLDNLKEIMNYSITEDYYDDEYDDREDDV